MDHWLVILAIDKDPIHTLLEGVVPATYKPTSEARWCMCKAETREDAIELAMDSFRIELDPTQSLAVASVARLCGVEAV